MTDRKSTRSFARSIALCAFSLAIACSATSATAGKPATSDFVIETKLNGGNYYDQGGHWYDYGRFQASGAIHDNGRAYSFFDTVLGIPVIELYGNGGDMVIALWRDENGDRFFTIIEATEAHSGLVGISGSASGYAEVKRNGDITVYHTLTGSIAP